MLYQLKKKVSQAYFIFAISLWSIILWVSITPILWFFLIPKRRRGLFASKCYCKPMSWIIVRIISGIVPVVEGIEKIPKSRKGYMVVSNHTSLLDIPLFMIIVGHNFIMKASLLYSPVGLPATIGGAIPLQRDNPRSQMKVMHEAIKTSQENYAIHIFAEGTRNRTGKLLPFKRGMIGLLYHAKVPVLPAAVWGNQRVIAVDFQVSLGRKVAVVVQDMVDPKDYASRVEFHEACVSAVESALERAKELSPDDRA